LPKSLAKGETAQLQIATSFTHTLVPFPAEITQGEAQKVRFNDNLYGFSPYESDSQKTAVKLSSSTVESHTEKEAKVNGDVIEYGPFSDVAPFTFEELSVHSDNNSPFVTMATLRKEIEISHWGNIAVEEHYLLKHTGAALKGGFSRYDYQRNPTLKGSSSFRTITAFLPLSADGIYYRDRIGNISTSHVRTGADSITFEVDPRFPMFGGWKTDFYMGYNLPAHEFLSIDASGAYVLNISFGSPFPQASIDEMELKVILPESSSNIQWTTPFDLDRESREVRVTYLDTVGRPVLVLNKNNVVRQHNQPLQVRYHFSKISLLQEPFLLVIAFFVVFVAAIAYMRFDLSISSTRS